MNVFFWAMKDGNLPVPKGQEEEYLAQRILGCTLEPYRHTVPKISALVATAIKEDNNVIAYDARHGLTQALVAWHQHIDVLREEADGLTPLRDNYENLQQRMRQISVKTGLHIDDLLYAWTLSEVNELIAKHPEYGARLQQLDRAAEYAKAQGLDEDGQSAAVFGVAADSSRNSITIGGGDHNSGMQDIARHIQGNFPAYLERNGMMVTPVQLISSKELHSIAMPYDSPGGEGYAWAQKSCHAKAPMHLWVMDQGVTLDVSDPAARFFDAAAQDFNPAMMAVARDLVTAGTKLTCDNPSLPTTAQRAREEAARGADRLH